MGTVPPDQRPHDDGLGWPGAGPAGPAPAEAGRPPPSPVGPLPMKASGMPSAAAPPRAAQRAAVAAFDNGGGGGDADKVGDAEPSESRSVSGIMALPSLRHCTVEKKN